MECQASEADPVDQGEISPLRLSTPTPPRVRFLRDPAADAPTVLLVVRVVGWERFFLMDEDFKLGFDGLLVETKQPPYVTFKATV